MFELNVKDNYSDCNKVNKNEVSFKKFEEEDDNKGKRKNSKKSKNKNYNGKLKDEFLKKFDENEYLGNKNKILGDDEYNSENINFKTALNYFSSLEYKEEQELIDQEKKIIKLKKVS